MAQLCSTPERTINLLSAQKYPFVAPGWHEQRDWFFTGQETVRDAHDNRWMWISQPTLCWLFVPSQLSVSQALGCTRPPPGGCALSGGLSVALPPLGSTALAAYLDRSVNGICHAALLERFGDDCTQPA
jgi:hypothetical protein